MRKQFFPFLALFFTISVASFAQVEHVTENQVGISQRLQQEIEMTKDPSLGYVPKARLIKAYQERSQRLSQPTNTLNGAPFTWIERGPNSDAVGPSNGNTRPGNGKTSGRVRAIWQDLSDPLGKVVWVGGIDGGLWKTNDITANPATWVPINDFFGNLSVASICQDPTNPDIMYFGTGEKAINADAVRGAGLWRSTDHGVTWSEMAGTSNYWNVSKMICDNSGNLYVGCNTISNNVGMLRFTKSSSTWTNITPTGLAARVPDIELSSTGRLHITCGYYNTAAGSSGYRYTDNPATVTAGTWSSPATTFTTQYNVDLASNGNTLYALPSNASFEVATIYKSTNGGVNWSATGTTPASLTNGQAWYDMIVGIDPKNANNVIVGGLNCWKSTNGGTSWTQISNWVGTSGQYVHADQQTILWDMNNQVLIGSDGGVHYSANGGTTFTDRNQGLRIKQFYAVAVHPTSTNYFLAGAQDNGVHQLNSAGLGASVEVTGGDGAFVHIDQDQPQYQWGSYVYNQYRRSTNGGTSWSSINYSSSAGRFINPTDYDDDANIMYCAGNANAYVRWSNPQSGSTFTSVTMSGLNSGKVSAVKVSPYTSNLVFFGGGGSGVGATLIKASNANATPTFTSIASAGMAISSGNISSIELGTSDQFIIVAYSNYGVNNIWVSSNGGTTWTSVDGNLPDMPVRWAMFYPGDNTRAIIATETGVWQTSLLNGASTSWDPETGFPNVRTDMLQYRESDGLLAAATHGRGIFTTIIGSAPTCGDVSGLTASSITTNSASVSWAALSGALTYDVDYKLASSGTWISAATATSGLSVALSGLSASSLYDYRVRANCTGATGAYTQAQFTTAAAPTCGTVSGLNASAITTNTATVSWSALSGALSYDVDYKLNSSGTWINAASATSSLSASLSGLTASSLYDYRVRANCSGATGSYTQAQFTTATPSCGSVTGLNAAAVTTSSATVSWSALGGANNYDVDYKLNSSGTWINAATATSGLSVALSGLSASSLYDYRVRANCTGATGAYTSAQFTTAAPPSCGNVTGLAASAITINSASISWSALAGANNYDVDYKLSSSGTWINAATATTNLSVNLSGLSDASDYDYRVRANCTGATGAYSTAQFTTASLPTCGTVSGLAATAITTSSATLSWSALSGALTYDVDYKLSSSGTWTNAATATSSLSVGVSGLVASSLYDYRVRANCSGATGVYTPDQFTTATPPPDCPGIYDVSTNGTVSGAATISLNTDVYGLINVSTDVDYYKFVIASAGTATITLTNLPTNYDLYLYSSNGTTQLASSTNGGPNSETINWNFAAGTYYVKVIAFKKSADASACYTLRIQAGTASFQDLTRGDDGLQVKIFPNPVHSRLNIYLLGDNIQKSLQMFDINGKLIYSQKMNDMFTTLDLQKLAKGMYVIKIRAEDGRLLRTEKFIKN